KPSNLPTLPRDGDRPVFADRRRCPVVPTQDCKVQFRQQGTTYVCSKSRNENLTRQNDPTLGRSLTAGTFRFAWERARVSRPMLKDSPRQSMKINENAGIQPSHGTHRFCW